MINENDNPDSPQQAKRKKTDKMSEKEIDDNLEESFPAIDPPSGRSARIIAAKPGEKPKKKRLSRTAPNLHLRNQFSKKLFESCFSAYETH